MPLHLFSHFLPTIILCINPRHWLVDVVQLYSTAISVFYIAFRIYVRFFVVFLVLLPPAEARAVLFSARREVFFVFFFSFYVDTITHEPLDNTVVATADRKNKNIVVLLTPWPSLPFISIVHGWMARLSSLSWKIGSNLAC